MDISGIRKKNSGKFVIDHRLPHRIFTVEVCFSVAIGMGEVVHIEKIREG